MAAFAKIKGSGLSLEPRVAAYRLDHGWRPSPIFKGGDLPLEPRVAAFARTTGGGLPLEPRVVAFAKFKKVATYR